MTLSLSSIFTEDLNSEIQPVDSCLSILSIIKNREHADQLKHSLNDSSLSCYKLQQCYTHKEGLQLLNNCKFDVVIIAPSFSRSKRCAIIQKIRNNNYRRPLLALTQTFKTANSNPTDLQLVDAVISYNDLSPSLIGNLVRNSVDKYYLSELRNSLNQQLNLALDAGKMGAWSYSCENKLFELDTITADMLGFPSRPCRKTLEEVLQVVPQENRDELRDEFEKAGQGLAEFETEIAVCTPPSVSRICLQGRFREEEAGRYKLLVGIAKDSRLPQRSENSAPSLNTIPLQAVLDKQFAQYADNSLRIDKKESFQKVLKKLSNRTANQGGVENKKFPFDFSRQPNTDFSPPNPLQEGFVAAAQRLVAMTRKGHNLDVSININNTPSIEIEKERDFLFTILRELLTNVAKHAKASLCIITIHKDEGDWVLQVEDDGIGIEKALKTISPTVNEIGLFSIRTQLALKGGHLDIGTASPVGLIARVRLPINLAKSS
ncbi:ATP-binding protein [Puniceicoccaceae bacterium K14]|nr:ATP-binding protein [Puniceicoccaceae bacterium K14]